MTWHHTAAILAYVVVAFAVGLWVGARSRVSDWFDGYRAGREDGTRYDEARHLDRSEGGQ